MKSKPIWALLELLLANEFLILFSDLIVTLYMFSYNLLEINTTCFNALLIVVINESDFSKLIFNKFFGFQTIDL